MDQSTLKQYKERFDAVSKPQTSEDWEEYNRLSPIIQNIKKLENLKAEKAEAESLLEKEGGELKKLAKQELTNLGKQLETLEEKLKEQIKQEQFKPDPNDKKNAIIEIRAGAGGEEAALFSAELFRMYSQYASQKGFKVQVLNRSLSDTGGLKEIVAKIEGKGSYGLLKYESGVHRVQRVPTTESSGRIHTSTSSVAVLPEAEKIDLTIEPADIRVESFRASGAGGQCVNKTDSAVRITHKPTGIVVSCQECKSQHQNKETAMSILRTRLFEHKRKQEQKKRSDLRKDQIGSAMRSEKIRTYNYPQDRITDHRIKESWHNIESILDGDLDELINNVTEGLKEQQINQNES
jgi:peptide chain release factor 1